MLFVLILYVLDVSIRFCQTQCLRDHGPYREEELSFGPCKDGFKDEMIFNIKRHRYREDTDGSTGIVGWCYTGWVFLPNGFNNSFEAVEERFCEDSIGMWKKYDTQHMKDTCFLGLLHGYPHWLQAIRDEREQPIYCPLPSGNYTISCVDLKSESNDSTLFEVGNPNPKNFSRYTRSLYDQDISEEYFYGKYKHIVKYNLNNKRVGCYEFKRMYERSGLPTGKYPDALDSPQTFGEMKRHLKSIMEALVFTRRSDKEPRTDSAFMAPDFFGRYAPPFMFYLEPIVIATYVDMENKGKLPEGAISIRNLPRSKYIYFRSSNRS